MKALDVCRLAAKIVAKAKKPHRIAEMLVLPACTVIVNKMLGPQAVEQIAKVPLSGCTIGR